MFTLEQKISIVQCYFRNGEGLENGEWSYSTPRVFEEFQQQRQWTTDKKTAENIEEVKQRIAQTPNKSIRRLTQETNLSFGTVQLTLKKDFHLFPYCVSVVHEIKPLDNNSPTT
jgi:hypothetical protein